jgi:type I restriction enzyme, S subunit
MELKLGYKQTDAGVIPEDWEVVSIGQIAKFTSGELIKVSALHSQSSDFPVPVFGGNGIAGYTRNAITNTPSVVVGRVGQKCGAVYLSDGPAWITDNALYPRRIYRPLDMHFLALVLERARLNEVRNRNDLPLITQSIIHSVRIAWPSEISEQRAIAGALNDVDALIRMQERLIAKKRDIKQAVMQQLLTGKQRLPGFQGEWETVSLGELFSFKNGLNKGKEFFGVGTPIVNYMDVYQHYGLSGHNLQGRVTVNKQELKSFDVKKGDVFFTRTSETVEEIGIAATMLDDCSETVFSGFLLRARPKDESLCNNFKKYIFSSQAVRRQIVARSSYTTRALTNGRLLSAVILQRPPKEEQSAIAAVLSDMEAEIAALEQRRDKTRALKQGMMQELLTGRTRLIEVSQTSLMSA